MSLVAVGYEALFACGLSSMVRGCIQKQFPQRCWESSWIRDVIMSFIANCAFWGSWLHWDETGNVQHHLGDAEYFLFSLHIGRCPMYGVNQTLLLPAYHPTTAALPGSRDGVFAAPSHKFPNYQAAVQIPFMQPQCAKGKKSGKAYNRMSGCFLHPFLCLSNNVRVKHAVAPVTQVILIIRLEHTNKIPCLM